MKDNLEIERKYLIKMPSRDTLLLQDACVCDKIEQTYIESETGVTARVRKREGGERVEYTVTQKIRLTPVTCIEDEAVISENEYNELLKTRIAGLCTVEKLRYSFPYAGKIVEIDVYPFWDSVAILEVELSAEDEQFSLPEFVSVICEVTSDRRFKNRALAECIPDVKDFIKEEKQ